MSKLTFENTITPPTPATGDTSIFVDSADKHTKQIDDTGLVIDLTTDTGEANTASNVGTAGVGVFKQKTGVDLEFKKINPENNKVSVTDDVANDEIDIGINEGNIVHQNLSGAGTNTHSQIDTHLGSTSNPHGVTFTQAVAADAGTDITPAEAETLTDTSNADSLHTHSPGTLGVTAFKTIDTPLGTDPVASTPSDTLTLTSSDSSIDITGTAGSDTVDFKLNNSVTDKAITMARTAGAHTFAVGAPAVVTLGSAENSQASNLEWLVGAPTRITCKKAGWVSIGFYFDTIFTNATVSDEPYIDALVKKTGATIADSISEDGNYYSFSRGSEERMGFHYEFKVEVAQNDYLELFLGLQTVLGSTCVSSNPVRFYAQLEETLIGPKGDTGAGSSVSAEDNGSPVAGGPFDTLNFADNLTPTDGGGGTLNISATGGIQLIQEANSEGVSSTTSATYQQKLKMTTASLASGNYLLFWNSEIRTTGSDQEHQIKVEEDDTTILHESDGVHKTSANSETWVTKGTFKYLPSISGVKDFDIDFNAPATDTVEIRRARLILFKVN